jgi:uncharacterized protein
LSIGIAALLSMLAARVYLGRFDRLFEDHTIFAGVTYTDAHVTLTGMLVVCIALVVGTAIAAICAISAPRPRWLVASVVPAIVCYVVVAVVGWYVNSFIVKPNELVRERPFIAHNIEMTRRAYALDRIEPHPFPADTGIEAADPGLPKCFAPRVQDWLEIARQQRLDSCERELVFNRGDRRGERS